MSNKQINFIGWILFILSAIGFVIASIGSFWSMVGSILFLVACLVFLIPFFDGKSFTVTLSGYGYYANLIPRLNE